MKATIRADDTLMVVPESDIEAYALNQWAASNFKHIPGPGEEPAPKMIVDCGEYTSVVSFASVHGYGTVPR